MQSRELLEKLISFATVSRDSNLELIDFIQRYLSDLGITSKLTHNDEKTKANLYAVIGPADVPGVMLSGHTDVVPVDGQNWSTDPFIAHEQGNLIYGRGSCDMKGFIACVLSMLPDIDNTKMVTPLHLAFSYDEEIGCIGVRRLIDKMRLVKTRPRYCIVGEPTMMQPVVAHKGKTAATAQCYGIECHSSLAPQSVNAIYLATELISKMQSIEQQLIDHGTTDADYEVPHTTIHVGVINGGTALNIVPNYCRFEFEIRNLPADDPAQIIAEIEKQARDIVIPLQVEHPDANISIELNNEYPALNTLTDADVVEFVRQLTGANTVGKIAFGTEAGLFTRELGIETVVMGPGDIQQAHKPDEYIAINQLQRCDSFLQRLTQALYQPHL